MFGDKGFDDSNDTGHGTAVLGEMVGTLNGFGVTGISPGAKARVAPEQTIFLGRNRANAILLAVFDGKPGDVILLEMQTFSCGLPKDDVWGDRYGPAEEDLTVFEATRVAVANGFVVVAAAGNGNVNLDDPACQGKYDRTKRDSGAIIVGAGGSGLFCLGGWFGSAREKLDYSTYGSRVDVHGWGECVWTTGYGEGYKDPSGFSDQNKWYTGTFSGTSSASPIVAAAVANIQGIAKQAFGAPLKPIEVRQLLIDTGLPQLGDTIKHVGPLVNLHGAIDKLFAMQQGGGQKFGKSMKDKRTKSGKVPGVFNHH